jgi:hypothetical protein
MRAGAVLGWSAPRLHTFSIDTASAAAITPGRCPGWSIRLTQAEPAGACAERPDFQLERSCSDTEPFLLRIDIANDVRDCDGLTLRVNFWEGYFQAAPGSVTICRNQQVVNVTPSVGRGELTLTFGALAGGERLVVSIPFAPARSPICGSGTGISALGTVFTVQLSGPCCPFGDIRTSALLQYGGV